MGYTAIENHMVFKLSSFLWQRLPIQETCHRRLPTETSKDACTERYRRNNEISSYNTLIFRINPNLVTLHEWPHPRARRTHVATLRQLHIASPKLRFES